MQSNQKDRTICLILKKSYYENYLRFLFDSPTDDIIVKRDHEVGKYLFSRVRYCHPSELKNFIRKNETGHQLQLVMPAHGNDLSRNYCAYFTADDMARINDFIESSAYLDFRMMVQTGNIDLKMDRKTVIEIYSDLIFREDKYEMLKKDEWRKRKKIREWLKNSAKALSI